MDSAGSTREAVNELIEGERKADALFSRLGIRCYHATIIYKGELYAASFSQDAAMPGCFRIGLGHEPMGDADYIELMKADPLRPIFCASGSLDFKNHCAVANLGPLGFEPLSDDEVVSLAALKQRRPVTALKM